MLPFYLPDEFQDVAVLDSFPGVSQRDEMTIDLIEFMPLKPEAELFAAQAEGMASRMFAQDEIGAGNAY